MSTARTCGERGFTLIEFALVALTIGFVAILVFPRVTSLFATDSLRADSVRLAETIRTVRKYSVLNSLTLRLHLRLHEGAWRAESLRADGSWGPSLEIRLPGGALSPGNQFRTARFSERKETVGMEILIYFYPTGDADEAYLTVADAGGDERTIHIHPTLNRTEIAHGNLENQLP